VIELFKKYGAEYNLDYLLMAAQGYQESTLDQDVKSPVGAIGVMQVMPPTGKELNVGDITKVDANIHAGVKYMRFMMGPVLQGRADGQSEQGPHDVRGLQRRAGTPETAPA
jgi:membrane-bound lytic murein transglycosylase MltF